MVQMSVLQDIRLAFRFFWRTPSFTGIALLSIALSVGATGVVFTAIKAVLIDPLPYARPEELVQIRAEFATFEPSQSHTDWAFWSDAQEIIRRTRTLESIGIYRNAIFNLAGDASTPPEALYGLRISANLFPTLGVTPMLGRNILPDEDQPGHANEMILSYGLWTRRFNADRSVIGRSVKIDGHDCLVIGVMPAEFNFPMRRAAAHTPSPYVEFWAPRQAQPDTTRGALGVVARLRRGITLLEAQQDLASISDALSREFPATNRDHTLRLGLLRDRTVGGAKIALWFLMAASLMFLLIGCANVANLLLARGSVRQREIAIRIADPGFAADRILASVVLPAPERHRTPEQRRLLYSRFLDSVRALPGVESAGTVDALPFSGENHGGLITSNEAGVMEPNGQLPAEIDVVSSEYLQTMGVHLAEGRWFREEEMKGSNTVAIVNDVAADRLWPGSSAIDKQICVYCTPENPRNWKRVVGVVSSIRHAAMDGPQQANVYLSAAALEKAVFVIVRTNRPTGDMEKAIRSAIAGVDPNQPVFLSASLRTLIADSIADRRFIMTLLAVTGCLALAMSIAGVYGVTSYVTSRRTHEIGVRMALGATPGNVQVLVFRQGFFNAAIGLVLTLVPMRILRGMLVGFEVGKPSHAWVAVVLVAVTAAVACWVPAWRAARIDPMSALRQD